MAIPTILQGDTSSIVRLAIEDGDFAGCALDVTFHDVTRTFYPVQGGTTVSLEWTPEETAGFPLGTGILSMTVRRDDFVRTLPFCKIKVTDAPAEVYNEIIKVAPAVFDIPALLSDSSVGDVKASLNAVINALRAAATCIAMMACGFAYADLTPATPFDNIPGSATLSNIVDAAGASMAAEADTRYLLRVAPETARDRRTELLHEGETFRLRTYYESGRHADAELNRQRLSLFGGDKVLHVYGGTNEAGFYIGDDPEGSGDGWGYVDGYVRRMKDGVFSAIYFPSVIGHDNIFALRGDIVAATNAVVSQVTAAIPPAVTNVVNDVVDAKVPSASVITNIARSVVGAVWDDSLGVAWEARMHGGALYYIAVTNQQEVAE